MKEMALATIHKLVAVVLLLAGNACAEDSRLKLLNVGDHSKVEDPAYQLCKDEQFLLSSRDLQKYLAASKELASEKWAELEHYPCEKVIDYVQDGKRYEIKVNLSGAGMLTIGRTTRFFACDAHCRARAGWPENHH